MSEKKEKFNDSSIVASVFKNFMGDDYLENKKTFREAWDGMSEVYASRFADAVFEKLKKEFKKNPESAQREWSFLLNGWSYCSSTQKMESVHEAIFKALDNAGRLKQWSYLEMMLDQLKEGALEVPSFVKYKRSISRTEAQGEVDELGQRFNAASHSREDSTGWPTLLGVYSLRNAPVSVLQKWFEARETCESPSVLENKQHISECDLCSLVNTPPTGFQNACTAANAFYKTNSWLWDASQFLLEDDMKEVSAFHNALNYTWLKSWKKLLNEQNYEWPWDCERKFQLELFQSSLLSLHMHKPDHSLSLKEVLDVYMQTLALNKGSVSKSYLWGPETADKSVSLINVLKVYDKNEVDDFWAQHKTEYAEEFKKAISDQSKRGRETERIYFNKLRCSFVLTNVLQAFPQDKELFTSPEDIEIYKEKGIFYHPGAFELLKTLSDLDVALDASIYKVKNTILNVLNVDEEVKNKLQQTLLNHTLQKSIKKIEPLEACKKENFSRF